jgi:hypothetical protein
VISQFLIPVSAILFLSGLAYYAMIGVPISRLAGAGEEPEGFVFVRWSGRHTRYAIAIVLQGLVIGAAAIGAMFALAASGQLDELARAARDSNAQPDPYTILRQIQKIQLGVFAAVIVVNVLLTTFMSIAAIENRLRFFGAVGTGLRHFFPILAANFLLYVASVALTIAAGIVLFAAGVVFSTVVSALNSVLVPAAVAYVQFFLSLITFAAQFVFNVFYTSLWIAFPAIVYRRLSSSG